jgi:hypothetical protein
VGHAPTVGGVVCLLKRTVYKTLQFRSLKDDSSVLNVVYLEKTQFSKK